MGMKLSEQQWARGFEGLPEKDSTAIYKAGKVQKVDENQEIITEGDTDQTVYLILDGEFRVVKTINARQEMIGTLGVGEWVGEIAFIKEVPRTTSVISNTPSRILTLDTKAITGLDARIQLDLLKKFNTLATERIRDLSRREAELVWKNSNLVKYIKSTVDQERSGYEDSRQINTIITNIPRLPVYASSLMTRINDPEVSSKEVASMVKEDPSLAAMVLKTVNSSYYSFPQQIRDLQHAITMLGINQVTQIIISNAILSTMPQTKEFRNLQFHCVATAIIASEVASLGKKELAPRVETLGLLHDIGKSVILLLKHKHPKMDMFFDGLDHSMLGSMLLRHWNLPEDLCEMLHYQDFFKFAPPEDVPEQYRVSLAILAVSHLILDYLSEGFVEGYTPAYLPEFMQVADIGERSIDDVAVNHVLPALEQKSRGLPTWMQDFVKRCRR